MNSKIDVRMTRDDWIKQIAEDRAREEAAKKKKAQESKSSENTSRSGRRRFTADDV